MRGCGITPFFLCGQILHFMWIYSYNFTDVPFVYLANYTVI